MGHRSFLLEVTPRAFRPKVPSGASFGLAEATPGDASRCRSLWSEVGRGYWTERSRWNDERWRRHLQKPGVAFWIASRASGDVGFFELLIDRPSTKIEGFGLLPAWRGMGLGGALLSVATREAFATGATRVWLHTATDDHPNALPNYQARGYLVYRDTALQRPVRPRSGPRPRRDVR